jgi:hypothetical protein
VNEQAVNTDALVRADAGDLTAAEDPTSWQHVATGFLLAYSGATRAAYAGDLRLNHLVHHPRSTADGRRPRPRGRLRAAAARG